MERKKLEHFIPYIEKGKEKFYPVTIEYVFQYVYEENKKLYDIRKKIQKYFDRINAIQMEYKLIDDEEKLKELKVEVDQKTAYIMQNQDYFQTQFDLINSILTDNGIDGEVINDIDFWKKKVEPSQVIAFLDAVMKKDTSGVTSGKK